MAQKKQQVKDRRAKVEEMRKAQAAAERRKSLTFVGLAVLISLALIAIPAWNAIQDAVNDPLKKSIASFGVPAADAGCTEPTDDKSYGQQHDNTLSRQNYAVIPPTSGTHWPQPAPVGRRGFYTPQDTPAPEVLVHNLEHGYTVLWYLPSAPKSELTAIGDLAEKLTNNSKYRKFIAAPWDTSRGAFPEGKILALARWTGQNGKLETQKGHREFCGKLSGAAVEDFMKKYPAADAPEPTAM